MKTVCKFFLTAGKILVGHTGQMTLAILNIRLQFVMYGKNEVTFMHTLIPNQFRQTKILMLM